MRARLTSRRSPGCLTTTHRPCANVHRHRSTEHACCEWCGTGERLFHADPEVSISQCKIAPHPVPSKVEIYSRSSAAAPADRSPVASPVSAMLQGQRLQDYRSNRPVLESIGSDVSSGVSVDPAPVTADVGASSPVGRCAASISVETAGARWVRNKSARRPR